MLSGCDATTPTAPELRRPSVLSTCSAQLFSLNTQPVRPLFFLSAAGALLWLALAVGKRVPGKALWAQFSAQALRARPFGLFSSFLLPAHSFWLDAKLFLLVAPWGPIVSTFYIALLWLVLAVGKRVRPGKALKTSKQASKRASKQASKPEPAKSR